MLVLGEIFPRETEFVQQDVKAVDMTPWRLAPYAGIALIVAVIAIYVSFADFSVLHSKADAGAVESAEVEMAETAVAPEAEQSGSENQESVE